MQIHKQGQSCQYFSRNGLDHGEQSGYTIFNTVLEEQVKEEQYILDCELVAWNKKECAPTAHKSYSLSVHWPSGAFGAALIAVGHLRHCKQTFQIESGLLSFTGCLMCTVHWAFTRTS